MALDWNPDPAATFSRRLVRTLAQLGGGGDAVPCNETRACPDMWELDNGDLAVIGRDCTEAYEGRLPEGVGVGDGERLVVVPGAVARTFKAVLS
ncbi:MULTISPECIES: hypothetical protein [Actinosynnema]|uniref:hypothetical protein n=1 Tax=Actinosynnema TaxID=40566 RepID=UPI0020A46329|nr:hypothetical protein [Actinosynnema pretiosum]MCP2097942.1 hypothetical protein [Actinosynnema pretiosum]